MLCRAACRVSCKQVLHNEVVSQVQTLLTLLEGVLQARGVLVGKDSPASAGEGAAAAAANDPKALERVFLFCLAWGVGGLLDKKDRTALDGELRKLTDLLPKVSWTAGSLLLQAGAEFNTVLIIVQGVGYMCKHKSARISSANPW